MTLTKSSQFFLFSCCYVPRVLATLVHCREMHIVVTLTLGGGATRHVVIQQISDS